MAESEDQKLRAIADELKPQVQALADRFDNAETEDERAAIRKEAEELIARRLIRHMLDTTVVPQLLAVFGVQQFARGFGTGKLYATGGTIKGDLPSAMAEHRNEFVVSKP